VTVETKRVYTKYRLVAPKRKKKRTGGQWLFVIVGLGMLGWLIWQSGRLPGFGPGTKPSPGASPKPAQTNAPTRTAKPAATSPASELAQPAPAQPARPFKPRPVQNILEAQLALERRGISSGPIDGVLGSQTRAALRVYQQQTALPVSGELDPATKLRLLLEALPFTFYTITTNDLARLVSIPRTWLGKSDMERLDFESALELVSEQAHSHPNLIRRLNPAVDWTNVVAGTTVQVPDAELPAAAGKAAFVRIQLAAKTLQAFDASTNLLAHFPCSIARSVEKRPVGELRVAVIVRGPDYTFDPRIFPESPEARALQRKLRLPPGPNNPVGAAWIGLNRPGYGIHGTPRPEDVGRTESHGCFRLANWNAEWLTKIVWVGMPVVVME
jgi:lipoprotein-anchoring transpeptidase ErfK/SrfK